jgi:hypothetical protein
VVQISHKLAISGHGHSMDSTSLKGLDHYVILGYPWFVVSSALFVVYKQLLSGGENSTDFPLMDCHCTKQM